MTNKGLIVTGLVVAVGAPFIINAIQTMAAGNKADVALTAARLGKVNLTNVEILVDVAIDNPSRIDMTMTKPYVKAYIDGAQIANSIAENKTYRIAARQRTIIQNISLSASTLTIAQFIPSLFSLVKTLIGSGLTTSNLRLNKKARFDVYATVNGFNSITSKEFAI